MIHSILFSSFWEKQMNHLLTEPEERKKCSKAFRREKKERKKGTTLNELVYFSKDVHRPCFDRSRCVL